MSLTAYSAAVYLAYRAGYNARNAGDAVTTCPHNQSIARTFYRSWMRGYWERDSKGLAITIPQSQRRLQIGKRQNRPQETESESPGKRNSTIEVGETRKPASQSGTQDNGCCSSSSGLQADRRAIRHDRQLSLFETDRS